MIRFQNCIFDLLDTAPKTAVKYNFYDTPEFAAAMKHIQPVIVDILDKASVYATDILREANLLKVSEEEEIKDAGGSELKEEGVDSQAIRRELIEIMRKSSKSGDTKEFLDALNALQRHFPIERDNETRKYIQIKAKNNAVCANCRCEVHIPAKVAE